MIIQHATLRQFRCFPEQTFTFDARVVVVEGANGSGKSSLLEALHYCCYLRSFRTHLNRDMIQLERDFFFVDLQFLPQDAQASDSIQIGFSTADGKLAKLNQKPIQSYKELIAQFRIVTLAADDLELIGGAPELRRDFLNYALALKNPAILAVLKQYRVVLGQRNALIAGAHTSFTPSDEWLVWTRQLWELSRSLQEARVDYLAQLEVAVNELLGTYFADQTTKDLSVSLVYQPKAMPADQDFDAFWKGYADKLYHQEREWRRSLFGAHLDDFSVVFQKKRARVYASRGQQKLLVLLTKIAQLQQLSRSAEPGVLLLDDFMTDFDHDKVAKSIAALKDLQYQLFLSTPVSPTVFLRALGQQDVCHISL